MFLLTFFCLFLLLSIALNVMCHSLRVLLQILAKIEADPELARGLRSQKVQDALKVGTSVYIIQTVLSLYFIRFVCLFSFLPVCLFYPVSSFYMCTSVPHASYSSQNGGGQVLPEQRNDPELKNFFQRLWKVIRGDI